MDCHAVRAVVMGESQVVSANPVIFLAARVGAFHDVFAIVPFALAGEAPAFDLFFRKGRNVDVQQRFQGCLFLGCAKPEWR